MIVMIMIGTLYTVLYIYKTSNVNWCQITRLWFVMIFLKKRYYKLFNAKLNNIKVKLQQVGNTLLFSRILFTVKFFICWLCKKGSFCGLIGKECLSHSSSDFRKSPIRFQEIPAPSYEAIPHMKLQWKHTWQYSFLLFV